MERLPVTLMNLLNTKLILYFLKKTSLLEGKNFISWRNKIDVMPAIKSKLCNKIVYSQTGEMISIENRRKWVSLWKLKLIKLGEWLLRKADSLHISHNPVKKR